MSDPSLGLLMLGLIVAAIMMGFPTAFTLMGVGIAFGFVALWQPGQPWFQNHVFDLMVQRTYGVMTNDTLLSVPLFVFMGYVMERAALVDQMFHSVQLAFRRVPASLAVTTLLVCAFWGIASGIVGAVVVLMGVIALRPMLRAGYDVRLASGVITAGGTLGILIPPSVMLIVYAAMAGESIVKLYAAAMLPGFFLTFLYLLYVLGWALWKPGIAPKLPRDQYRVDPPEWLARLAGERGRVFVPLLVAPFRAGGEGEAGAPAGQRRPRRSFAFANALVLLTPALLTAGTLYAGWWYVVVHNGRPAEQAQAAAASPAAPPVVQGRAPPAAASPARAPVAEEALQELGDGGTAAVPEAETDGDALRELNTEAGQASSAGGIPVHFREWFWALVAISALLLGIYYRRLDGTGFQILKELVISVVPLGVLTFTVLAVILFGICTATESAAVGALGALYLAVMKRAPRQVMWWSLGGLAVGLALGVPRGDFMTILVSGTLGAVFAGTVVPWIVGMIRSPELRQCLKEATFLTAKTTAMVSWLFIGSAIFSGVFALHGGQSLVERWVLSMNLSPLGFMFMAQLIIFLLGWPLEWTEIIVIFCPIFVPLLPHFHIDPVLFGTMVAVNLQAAFLSPPVAMSAFYLKGVAPKHVTLNQIFAGMMPYMAIVCVCLVIMYAWPGMTLWLPEFLYGR